LKISRDTTLTLLLFVFLTVTLYIAGFWLIFRLSKATPLMLSVGLATILTYLIRKRDLSTLGWGWGSWKYQWLSYLIPLAVVTVAYLIIWFLGLGGWYNTEFILEQKENYNLTNWNDISLILFHFLLTGTIAFLLTLPSVLGEEIAWRGFLVPELSKFMTFTGVALVSGFVWALWHWPMMFIGIYGNNVTPLFYQLFIFTVYIMSCSVIMTYLRYKTNSIWTAVIFHMSGNVFMQKVFTPLTIEHANSAWYIDEFGLVPTLVIFTLAIYFWKKGSKEFSSIVKEPVKLI